MIETFLERICRERIPCFCISPHLDDAVFSMGEVLRRLAPQTTCQVITVFTAAQRPMTFSARQFLRQSGVADPEELFDHRRREDEAACRILGVQAKHLGFVDALFRARGPYRWWQIWPELSRTYPTYRWHVSRGRLSPHDADVRQRLADQLRAIIPHDRPVIIFAPLATGGHVDHVLVREVCTELFPQAVYWHDLPYRLTHAPDQSFLDRQQLCLEEVQVKEATLPAMRAYTSQFPIVYPRPHEAIAPEYIALRSTML